MSNNRDKIGKQRLQGAEFWKWLDSHRGKVIIVSYSKTTNGHIGIVFKHHEEQIRGQVLHYMNPIEQEMFEAGKMDYNSPADLFKISMGRFGVEDTNNGN